MTDRFDDLRDIYSRLGGDAVFTDHQQQPRGTVRADLGVTPETVFRARMALHLFADADAPPQFDAVARRLREGADRRAVAAALDVSLAAVDRVTRLVAARDAARRVNYQYTTEFADLLDGSAASTDLDRQRRNDRTAFVDAYDT